MTVIPPIPADQNVQIIRVAKTFEVKPQDNEFTIDVAKK